MIKEIPTYDEMVAQSKIYDFSKTYLPEGYYCTDPKDYLSIRRLTKNPNIHIFYTFNGGKWGVPRYTLCTNDKESIEVINKI